MGYHAFKWYSTLMKNDYVLGIKEQTLEKLFTHIQPF